MSPLAITAVTLTGILVLSTLSESIVEYLVSPFLEFLRPDVDEEGNAIGTDWRLFLMRYIAAAVGIILSYVYKADLLALLGLNAAVPWAGFIFTGFIIGRGSNFVHEFASRWLSPQTR